MKNALIPQTLKQLETILHINPNHVIHVWKNEMEAEAAEVRRRKRKRMRKKAAGKTSQNKILMLIDIGENGFECRYSTGDHCWESSSVSNSQHHFSFFLAIFFSKKNCSQSFLARKITATNPFGPFCLIVGMEMNGLELSVWWKLRTELSK